MPFYAVYHISEMRREVLEVEMNGAEINYAGTDVLVAKQQTHLGESPLVGWTLVSAITPRAAREKVKRTAPRCGDPEQEHEHIMAIKRQLDDALASNKAFTNMGIVGSSSGTAKERVPREPVRFSSVARPPRRAAAPVYGVLTK